MVIDLMDRRESSQNKLYFYKNLIKAKDIPQMNKERKSWFNKRCLGRLAFGLKTNLSQIQMD